MIFLATINPVVSEEKLSEIMDKRQSLPIL